MQGALPEVQAGEGARNDKHRGWVASDGNRGQKAWQVLAGIGPGARMHESDGV